MAEPEAPARTEALCPVCLRRLPALRVRRGDEVCHEVWLTRVCPEHGEASAVIWRGQPDFDSWRRPKTPSVPPVVQTRAGQGCPFDCGLCPEHGQHTCTAVVEVTDRCDLGCPVCFAGSGPASGCGTNAQGWARSASPPERSPRSCNPFAEPSFAGPLLASVIFIEPSPARNFADPAPACSPAIVPALSDPPLADPTLDMLAQRLAGLRRVAGACNLQLSGGEPTMRADLPEIIAAAAGLGFGLVQLNTNGLRLGSEPGYAQRLAQAGLQSVFLQFDGPDEACRVLRGRPLLAHKLRALDACAGAGLGVVLVPTLLRGVNERFLGAIVRLAVARMPVVRGVHFQPAASFGRFPGRMREADRLTLPEVLTLLVEQSGGQLRAQDFHPPGCEHERCSFSGRFAMLDGRLTPLAGGGCCEPGPLTPGQAFGQPLAQELVPSFGQASGQASGQAFGQASGQTSDQTSDQAPGQASGQISGQPFRQTHGQTFGQSATQPPDKSSDQPPDQPSDQPSGEPIPPSAAEGARRAKSSVAVQWAPAPAQPAPGIPDAAGRDDFERFLAGRGADKRLSISCMAFQDALTLDLERVRGCCIHTQAPDGRLVPFCLYNLTAADGTALYRRRRG